MRRYCLGLAMLSLAALGPSVARGDDQQIAQEIVHKLQAEKQAGTLKGFSIDLDVDEGTVWLRGRVASDQQLARALDLARRVAGVQQVVNDLTVIPTAAKPAVAAIPAQPSRQSTAASRRSAPAPSIAQSTASPAQTVAVQPTQSQVPQTAPMQTITAQPMPINPESASAPPPAVQMASVSQEFAAAANAGPIGSGVEATDASARRSTAQAAAPFAAAMQPQAALSPQPLPGFAPQGAPAAPATQVAMVPMYSPYAAPIPVYAGSQMQVPLAMGPARMVNYAQAGGPAPDGAMGAPTPMYMPGSGVGIAPARYDHPTMPGYAWPSYASHPNYAAVTYPKQYSPTAWPYIGPFYPYPQVPLGWRKVTLEWDDGWWMLDFKDRRFGGGHF